jgi:hypothetical protein
VEKFISGVVYTGEQFIAGVVDTSEKFMTSAITFFPGVVDTGQKNPKSLKFIACVNDIAD